MIEISDAMHARSVRIINEKRAALAGGDEALKQQVGEGKDIMSVLRESFRAPANCSRGMFRSPSAPGCIVRANMSASEADRLTDEELIAQVS